MHQPIGLTHDPATRQPHTAQQPRRENTGEPCPQPRRRQTSQRGTRSAAVTTGFPPGLQTRSPRHAEDAAA